MHHGVEVYEEQHTAPFGPVNFVQIGLNQWGHCVWYQVGNQLLFQICRVGKWKLLGVRLQEKIKRVVDRHVHDHIDSDLELLGLLWKHQPCLVV